jgi:peptidoglycan/LPS O-acetylase OafA/YrhL
VAAPAAPLISMEQVRRHRLDIDGLRAVAILPVMLYHARIAGFTGGFVGVDVFFVISGYLITDLIVRDLDEGRFSFLQFWLRRARRILPAVTVMMAAGLAIGWFVLLPNDYRAAGQSAFAQSFFASNFFFWSKAGYFFDSAETMPFLHMWSLAVEEQFYFLYPLLLVALTRYARTHRTWIVGGLLLLSLGLAVRRLGPAPEEAFYFPHVRAWELLVGAVTAFLAYDARARAAGSAALREVLSIAGVLAIAYAVTRYNRDTPFPGLAALAPCVGAALIIWANGPAATSVGRVLSWRPFVWVGLISYSLYLWHWPLLVFANYSSVNGRSKVFLLAVLGVAAVASWISYRWIETPIRRKGVLARPGRFIPAAAAAVLVVAAAGAAVYAANGLPSRLPPQVYAAYHDAFTPGDECSSIPVSQNLWACTQEAKAAVPDLIVWGDSHAGKAMPAIAELAKAAHLNVWKYICAPVVGVYLVSEARSVSGSNCAASNAALMKTIRDRGIRNVLFVSYWSQTTEGRDALMEGPGKRDPFYGDDVTRSSSSADARAVFRAHFIETVHALCSLGTRVWIMKEVPTHRYWVPNQLGKVLLFGGDPDRIGRPLSDLAARRAFTDAVFADVAGPEVHVLDPAPMFCDGGGFCHAAEAGQALYSDYNHVSLRGAMKLRPVFEPMLAGLKR